MDYTKLFTDTFNMLLLGMSFLFGPWFIVIFSPLGWRGKYKNRLLAMFIIWLVIALIRIALLLTHQNPPFVLLPEPVNTGLFVSAGPILLIAATLQRRWQRQKFQKKANSLRQIE